MNTAIKLITFSLFLSVASANLYGVWQDGNTANFGIISETGVPTMKLEFPGYTNWHVGNSAMNNFTSMFTFVLSSNNIQYLVSVNVATNKVLYFAPIPEGKIPYGLKYDPDVNSMKCVLQGSGNNTWLVGEMDPASASYDTYGMVQGAYLSTGLSPYNHSYFVVVGVQQGGPEILMYSYDTRSGQETGDVVLLLPQNFIGGPYNLLYIPTLDVLVCNILIKDENDNTGMDYAIIDIVGGTVKPLGIFTPSQAVSVVSHAAHGSLIYANVNNDANLQFVTIDLSQNKQLSSTPQTTFVVSMGYFTNY
ncbi:hypothetical protein DFA_07568 [Cavenderia fasciculata]|uniref:Uncharacterized protein n=1 Tax=Cavenderia fasciculata TaxID=261658 RepID=F4PWT0_CACFS|nr:uncharacterized protein DFA_07568 [Cavenderia fasciculata]EGG20444.1 hypothetical protein DFA_07568 [Cavenderia fasciculata]|eukprot:XP_004367427.1 hypothetical protein DFA_07568 [Cavenderia fasciculata]